MGPACRRRHVFERHPAWHPVTQHGGIRCHVMSAGTSPRFSAGKAHSMSNSLLSLVHVPLLHTAGVHPAVRVVLAMAPLVLRVIHYVRAMNASETKAPSVWIGICVRCDERMASTTGPFAFPCVCHRCELGGLHGRRGSVGSVRVYEIAKEVGVPNKEMIAKIRALGLEVNNHMSSLDAEDVDRIRRALQPKPTSKKTKADEPPVARRTLPSSEAPRILIVGGATGTAPTASSRGARRSTIWETERPMVLPPESDAHRLRVARQTASRQAPAPEPRREPLIVIDGSNVGGWPRGKRFSFGAILGLCCELKRLGRDFVCYFDATARHRVREEHRDESNGRAAEALYEKLLDVARDNFVQVAFVDPELLSLADAENAIVISDDRYKDFRSEYAWLGNETQRRARVFAGTVLRGQVSIAALRIRVSIPTDLTDSVRYLTE